MKISVPNLSLIVLIGASGAGKSTFGKKYFKEFEVISSDYCRGLVSNDENDQSATREAFDLLNTIVAKRLKKGLLTVVDATNVQVESRKPLINLAREYHAIPVAIVFDLPQQVSLERNRNRKDRIFGGHVIRQQKSQLRRSLKSLKREGFRHIINLNSEDEVNSVEKIVREKLYNDKRELKGPFDIIGDIHGCFIETKEILQKLNYNVTTVEYDNVRFGWDVTHPEKRQVIFLGDLVDRGPNSPEVLKLVMSMVNIGIALCIPGNHDIKLQKWLSGKNVSVKHGLAETIEQLNQETEEFKEIVKEFTYSLISHYVLDGGDLVVSHAGLKEEMQGRGSGAVRAFCLFGESTGEIDEYGLPVRYPWAEEYRGRAKVVYGHTPIPRAEWLNRTLNIDTGCVFGGELTALRYPEDELVSVKAKETYCEPVKPFQKVNEKSLTHQQEIDDALDINDIIGKRIIQTRLRSNITILEENSIAALEVMSRFAVNPKWLIYLPPTMSPSETSDIVEYLEHPLEAVKYYKNKGIEKIICEEKHMGSRVVLVICKDDNVAKERFGIENEGFGKCFTRTGRNFFINSDMENQFLTRVRDGLSKSGFWETHNTDWVCLDAELMPWSAKAQSLIQDQYAAVGASASNALPSVVESLNKAKERGIEGLDEILDLFDYKNSVIDKYKDAYRQYCWDVKNVEDYNLAPFHILATEGSSNINKDHKWHMDNIHSICDADNKTFKKTQYRVIDTDDEEQIEEMIKWWIHHTSIGGEGMVVKPLNFVAHGKGGLLQPAIKCRGREYLRIIYGPEYDLSKNLKKLKNRSLSKKRSLALREFALGIEALERFIEREPLRRVHESVFGVLALESVEVDPRL